MTTKAWPLAAAAALALAGAQGAAAQDAEKARKNVDAAIELLRKDVATEKSDLMAKNMKLDATQAAAFWPIYKQYEAERKAIGDDRVAVIQDLAEHFDSLNDAKAQGLLERSFAIEDKRVALQRKYKDEVLKVLPAKTVARFFQIDSRLNHLIDLGIASQIPLVP
jgi:hypothetical protein